MHPMYISEEIRETGFSPHSLLVRSLEFPDRCRNPGGRPVDQVDGFDPAPLATVFAAPAGFDSIAPLVLTAF